MTEEGLREKRRNIKDGKSWKLEMLFGHEPKNSSGTGEAHRTVFFNF